MPKKNSSEYWEQRIAQNTWDIYNNAEEKNRALLNMYKDASKSVTDELYRLAEKLQKQGFKNSDIHKNNRLVSLNLRMMRTIKELGGDIEQFAKGSMFSAFQENYAGICEELGGIDFSVPNKDAMEQMLKQPWRGSDFSSRLWENTRKLSEELNSSLLHGIQMGKTITEMAIDLDNAMQKGFNVAHRLVRTETMHALNQSSLDAYKASGIKKVQFWAAEDERTCEHCGALHGKIFDIDKAPALPVHANCRCTYLPVIELVPQMDMSSDELVKYSKEEIREIAKQTKDIADKHITKESKWSGNIVLNPKDKRYGKLWNCDISTMDETSGHILLHEQLHAKSISYYDIETYSKYYKIEEATVQLMTQEISKVENIGIIPSGYDEMADALREINKKIGFSGTDYEFAKALINMPVSERLGWIENEISDIMNKNGTIDEFIHLSELVGLLEV